jgi:redox-sensing transcriptional repressor
MPDDNDNGLLYFPKATLERLKRYQLILSEYGDREYLASDEIAERLKITPEQVRKDISYIKYNGKPKVGYHTKTLLEELNRLFGMMNKTNVIIVGTGHLGGAIANYHGLSHYGMEIVALFDSDPKKQGTFIRDLTVLPLKDMQRIVKRFKVEIGVICVPKESAQEVADTMIACGVRAIWNFAPTLLRVPEDIVVEDENITISLLSLKHKLEQRRQERTLSKDTPT